MPLKYIHIQGITHTHIHTLPTILMAILQVNVGQLVPHQFSVSNDQYPEHPHRTG